MKRFFYIITLSFAFLFSSCAHKKTKSELSFDQNIKNNKCEVAAVNIPVTEENASFFSSAKNVGMFLGSYTISLATLTAGVALSVMAKNGEIAPAMGRWGYDSTKKMRCPDLDDVSKRLRIVSNCYADRKTELDFRNGLEILLSIKRNNDFYGCLGDLEKKKLDTQHKDLKDEIVSCGYKMNFDGVAESIEEIGLSHNPPLGDNCQFISQLVETAPVRGLINSSDGERVAKHLLVQDAKKCGANYIHISYRERISSIGTFVVANAYKCEEL